MSTKSAKIAAQIAELEAAMAEAKAAERERMKARVIRVAEQSGLLDVMIDSKTLAQAFGGLVARAPAEPETKTKKEDEIHGHE